MLNGSRFSSFKRGWITHFIVSVKGVNVDKHVQEPGLSSDVISRLMKKQADRVLVE